MSAQQGDVAPAQARLKRLRMRSWRRGTKEMDLILGPFADARLDAMEPGDLDLFEVILDENDQDLYLWVTGKGAPPEAIADLLAEIAQHARDRLTPRT